jgi:hypothetical protein
MVSKKRTLEDAASPKAKKSKLAAEGSADKKGKREKAKAKADKPLQHTSNVVPEEIDFPRGGGTSFTPQEVKTIRAEAMKEADELFEVRTRITGVYVLPFAYVQHGRTPRRRRKGYAKRRMPRVKARRSRETERKQMLFG